MDVKIKGMDCAECASRIQEAIQSVPDVEAVDVLLSADQARITYSDRKPNLELIERAVKSAGYEVISDGLNQNEDTQAHRARRAGQPWLAAGLLSGLLLIVLMAGEWWGLFNRFLSPVPPLVWGVFILAGGWPIFRNVALAALKGKIISHSLMTLGVVGALLVGEWVTAALIVLFMRIGSFVEGATTDQARSAVRDLSALAPQYATLLRGQEEVTVPIAEVKPGDVALVRPGEKIPVDGQVISGRASVDQSAISGESMPAEVQKGSRVFAASMALDGALTVDVQAAGEDSTYGRIIQLVEEAETHKADVQRVADRFATLYLPVVAIVALLTLLIRGDPLAAAATLVVACSCSFALATPIAMLATIGSAARRGLLIKGGRTIEILDKVTTLFVDKTGTLTLGQPMITDIISTSHYSSEQLAQLTASVERYSKHPLAKAFLKRAKADDVVFLDVADFTSAAGIGVAGQIGGKLVSITNQPVEKSARAESIGQRLAEEGKTSFFVHIDGVLCGIIAARDEPRPGLKAELMRLKEDGIRQIVLISGDKEAPVRSLADELGIDYAAGLLPEEKTRMLQAAQSRGERVAMVGDGINDAPALAQADVGIAMGETGSQIAIETSQVTLLREDWSLVGQLFALSHRTMRVVRANILFTIVYNMAGLSLAALGLLPPALAAALQALPDVGILANSARLIRAR